MCWAVFVVLEIAEMFECGALRELRKEYRLVNCMEAQLLLD